MVDINLLTIICVIIGMVIICFGNYRMLENENKNVKLLKNDGIYLLLLGIFVFFMPLICGMYFLCH